MAHNASPLSLDRQFMDGVHFALDGFTKGLVSRLAALLEAQLPDGKGSRSTARRIVEQAVASEVPALLEQEFVARFFSNEAAARQHRTVLVHLLTAADVHAAVGSSLPFPALPIPAGRLSRHADEVTSEEAAKLLHVSRTHLNSLADEGHLGPVRRTEGGHRRILRAELDRYLIHARAQQVQGLDDMVEATKEMGLYDAELTELREKKKRHT